MMNREMKKRLLLLEKKSPAHLKRISMLESMGFELRSVHNAIQAIEAVAADPVVDLVMADCGLGEQVHGVDEAGLVRQILDKYNLPLVFLEATT